MGCSSMVMKQSGSWTGMPEHPICLIYLICPLNQHRWETWGGDYCQGSPDSKSITVSAFFTLLPLLSSQIFFALKNKEHAKEKMPELLQKLKGKLSDKTQVILWHQEDPFFIFYLHFTRVRSKALWVYRPGKESSGILTSISVTAYGAVLHSKCKEYLP